MVHILKKEVEKKIGQEILTRGDSELLANAILDTLDIQISYNTIRRLFDLAPNVKPSRNTLNTLAKFIGYKDYIQFRQLYFQEEKQSLSVLVFRTVYGANEVEIIDLVKKTKRSVEDFTGFIVTLSRELLHKREYQILNKVFELEELDYNSFSYSEIINIGNSIGLLLRQVRLKDSILHHNQNFLNCVYLTFVDYSNLNGYYANWTKRIKKIKKNKKTKELQVFTNSILKFSEFLNQKKMKDSFGNLAFSKGFHPILCSRILSIKIMANNYDDLEALLSNYFSVHSKKKSLMLDYSFELFITAVTTKNITLMQYLIEHIQLEEKELFYYQKYHLSLFYLMSLFYYKLTDNKSKQRYYEALFDVSFVRYCYEDYVRLLYNSYLYAEAKTKSSKASIKTDLLELSEKLNYPYFSESFILKYFKD